FAPSEATAIASDVAGDLDFGTLGLDVMCPALVRAYPASIAVAIGGGECTADVVQRMTPQDSPGVIFDPLYGYAIVRRPSKDVWLTVPFADMAFRLAASSVPPPLRQQILSKPMHALSIGSILAHDLLAPILPDHGHATRQDLQVPEIPVHTEREFYRLIERMQRQIDSMPDLRMWFRGQKVNFLTPDRSELVKRNMAGYCSVRDSSLLPSVYRPPINYQSDPERFAQMIRSVGDWAVSAEYVLPESVTILDEQGRPYSPKPPPPDAKVRMSLFMAGSPHQDIPGIDDLGPYFLIEVIGADGKALDRYIKLHHPGLHGFRRSLLLQHYGCPTSWLDITHDPGMALWFAVHEMRKRDDGNFLARRVSAPDPSGWPTVYVFLLNSKLHPVIDTAAALRDSRALRPQRQACGLLGGAGSLARNYAARFISLKLRLGPELWRASLPEVREVFPGPDEDDGLKELLRRAQNSENEGRLDVYQVWADDR
ncbi:MAG TPA: FRG domain-containing protein, partial [Polyangiaceae bacterium]|nr:FRG domain-containing protein [Polyangiaceae bacterium]